MTVARRPIERAPSHPGPVLALLLENRQITQIALAEAIKMSRVTVNKLMKGRQALTIPVALKIEAATGITAETLMELQVRYSLWRARSGAQGRKP